MVSQQHNSVSSGWWSIWLGSFLLQSFVFVVGLVTVCALKGVGAHTGVPWTEEIYSCLVL